DELALQAGWVPIHEDRHRPRAARHTGRETLHAPVVPDDGTAARLQSPGDLRPRYERALREKARAERGRRRGIHGEPGVVEPEERLAEIAADDDGVAARDREPERAVGLIDA